MSTWFASRPFDCSGWVSRSSRSAQLGDCGYGGRPQRHHFLGDDDGLRLLYHELCFGVMQRLSRRVPHRASADQWYPMRAGVYGTHVCVDGQSEVQLDRSGPIWFCHGLGMRAHPIAVLVCEWRRGTRCCVLCAVSRMCMRAWAGVGWLSCVQWNK